jgi:hypothetical protein
MDFHWLGTLERPAKTNDLQGIAALARIFRGNREKWLENLTTIRKIPVAVPPQSNTQSSTPSGPRSEADASPGRTTPFRKRISTGETRSVQWSNEL